MRTNPNSTRLAVYDAVNRLSSYTDSTAVGLPISGGQYTYDGEGNIVGMTQELPLLPTLTGSQSTYTYDAADQIVSVNGVNYTHDANGNLTRTRDAQFSYDYENRLTQAVSTGRTLQYQYDGAGRRMARTVNGAKTGYILNVRPFLYSPIAETDASGNITKYYVYGAQGELLSMVDPSGSQYYYHYDHIGNTLALTDTNGSVVNTYAYEPFGRLAGQGETVSNPFKYVGRYGVTDEGDDLYYMRARYYDSGLGRFLNRDPIGLVGGVNLYTYVGNNPINFVDPLGLSPNDWWDPRFYTNFWGNFFGGTYDFYRNYRNMRDAFITGADKYFHCMANCQASRRGFGGREAAVFISEGRELFDEYIKRDPRSVCDKDRAANRLGREGDPKEPCEQTCAPLRPPGLNPKY